MPPATPGSNAPQVPLSGARFWWVVLGLAFGTCISNGFARFAYGLILPAMREDLSWGYAQAGWMNTANALGYLAGAILTLRLLRVVSQNWLFGAGSVACALAILATGLTRDATWLSTWRIASGVFGAPVFICAGTLAAGLSDNPRRAALAIALTFGGGGLSMVLAGATIPGVLNATGAERWPLIWVAIATVSALMVPLVLWTAIQVRAPTAAPAPAPFPLAGLWPHTCGYFLFATGYIVYLTFLVAWMRTLGASPVLVSVTWCIVGTGTIVSSFIWGPLIGRRNSGTPFAMIMASIALGTVIPVVLPTPAGLILSATVFGLSVFMAPTAVTGFMGRNMAPAARGNAMAVLTVVFATGQTLGPVAAGAIGDRYGTIAPGLLAAGLILALGAVVGALQRPLRPGAGRDIQPDR
ncbi:MAG: YbfB/YjiJ family MFS transporter [Pseudomonadota bacterium]